MLFIIGKITITDLAELHTGTVGVGVEEDLSLAVQTEPGCLVEEDGVVAITDGDQVVLPGGVVSTALGLELELHGQVKALRHLDVGVGAAGWLRVVGGGVAGAGDDPTLAVDRHQGDVDGRLLAASTGLTTQNNYIIN